MRTCSRGKTIPIWMNYVCAAAGHAKQTKKKPADRRVSIYCYCCCCCCYCGLVLARRVWESILHMCVFYCVFTVILSVLCNVVRVFDIGLKLCFLFVSSSQMFRWKIRKRLWSWHKLAFASTRPEDRRVPPVLLGLRLTNWHLISRWEWMEFSLSLSLDTHKITNGIWMEIKTSSTKWEYMMTLCWWLWFSMINEDEDYWWECRFRGEMLLRGLVFFLFVSLSTSLDGMGFLHISLLLVFLCCWCWSRIVFVVLILVAGCFHVGVVDDVGVLLDHHYFFSFNFSLEVIKTTRNARETEKSRGRAKETKKDGKKKRHNNNKQTERTENYHRYFGIWENIYVLYTMHICTIYGTFGNLNCTKNKIPIRLKDNTHETKWKTKRKTKTLCHIRE